MCSLMPHAVPFGACFVKKDTVACSIHYKAWQDAVIYGFLAFSKGHFDFFLLLLSKFRCFYGAVFVFEKLVPRWNFTVCSSVLSPFFQKKRIKYLFMGYLLYVPCHIPKDSNIGMCLLQILLPYAFTYAFTWRVGQADSY